jgi:hypothetical protein
MSTALTTTTTVRELTKLCKTGRQAYLEAVQRRDEMEAAMIRADALLSAIEAAQTEQAAAALLRMAHPDAGMVEVVGEGSNRETVRVMAMALFCGFTPGRQEFAIFHGRVKSALYLKDAGIRKLLVQMGCEPPTANAGFPMQVQLKSGLTVWAVEGEASTVYDGKTYRVAFTGPGAVKLPCKFFKNSSDSSDNIDGIIAKARRRMLLELMRVVQSAAGMTPEDSNEGDDTTIDARLEVIDAGPVQQQSAPELDILSEVAALQTKLSPPHASLLGDAHADLVGATSEAQLRTVWEAVNREAKESKLDRRAVDLLVRIKDARKQELTSEV